MNKKIALMAIAVLGLVSFTDAQANLEITIKNISKNEGSIRVALFKSEEDFLKKALSAKEVKVSGGEVICIFENVEEGEYAVSAFHDLNDNSSLDKNWVGMPVEPYGFSNDARGMFGPPSYSDAKFVVEKGSNKKEFAVK